MSQATTSGNIHEDGVWLRLLALALDQVQKSRRLPKKNGRLHRV